MYAAGADATRSGLAERALSSGARAGPAPRAVPDLPHADAGRGHRVRGRGPCVGGGGRRRRRGGGRGRRGRGRHRRARQLQHKGALAPGPVQQARMDVTWEGEGSEKSDSRGKDGAGSGWGGRYDLEKAGLHGYLTPCRRMGESSQVVGPPWSPAGALFLAQHGPRSGLSTLQADTKAGQWPGKIGAQPGLQNCSRFCKHTGRCAYFLRCSGQQGALLPPQQRLQRGRQA